MDEMQITSAQYVNDEFTDEAVSIKATIDGVEMFVPLNQGNRHFIAIQKAVENGQLTIADAE